MKEIKPCPFCGSKAEVYEECGMVKIRCSSYMCQASVNCWHDEVEDAIEAWNKRATTLQTDEFKNFDREDLILLIECQKERIGELLADKDTPQTERSE